MADFPPTAGLINSLDPANPIDANKVFGGNNWLAFIQEVLKTNQFPISEDGSSNGWDLALTVKASEVNSLDGITGTVQTRLNALEADAATLPSGTVMAFWQAAAPSGWTQVVSEDDAMLRVVSTAGGGNGGTASPISMAGSDVPAHSHTGSTGSDGAHTHSAYYDVGSGSQSRTFINTPHTAIVNGSNILTRVTGGSNYILTTDGAHTHPATIDDNSGPTDWEPKYIDMILASKD